MATNFQFSVIGEQKIHCSSCEERIVRVLKRVPGIQNVLASAGDQHIAVLVDPTRVTAGIVQAKLGEIGYEVAANRGNLGMPPAERASVPPQNANIAFRGPRVAGNRSRDSSDQRERQQVRAVAPHAE